MESSVKIKYETAQNNIKLWSQRLEEKCFFVLFFLCALCCVRPTLLCFYI